MRAFKSHALPLIFDPCRRRPQVEFAPVKPHTIRAVGRRRLHPLDADLGDLEMLHARVGLESEAKETARRRVRNGVAASLMALLEEGFVRTLVKQGQAVPSFEPSSLQVRGSRAGTSSAEVKA